MASQQAERAGRSVKSAERVLDLLETIGASPNGTTFSDLGASLGIPKSSLHALLNVLTSRGYIEFDQASRRISLGIRIWETGLAYHRHHGFLKEARAVMENIVRRINETVQLAKLAGSENIYLDKVDSTHPLRLQSEVGLRLSAHATGVGKALLAQLDEADVGGRFPAEMSRHTPNTIGTLEALLDELALTRKRGFAVDNEEYTPGIFCLAVPVYQGAQRATIAMSASVPTSRVTRQALPNILSAMADGSVEITQRIGGQCPDDALQVLTDPVVAAARIEEMLNSGRYPVAFA
ncbi:IclR family transcriptional regulator [Chelativorans sp. Marseille-P2723]|uniref:IclR family transcriptional regulator n=1 Tax=Chelativorans sp. Marseille-P2723 TaxID=2709133 RepID=UPI001570B380|nr:IclR family transcriptional regulator [Chelativorans sp. Marseille-P2723]